MRQLQHVTGFRVFSKTKLLKYTQSICVPHCKLNLKKILTKIEFTSLFAFKSDVGWQF